MGKTAAITGAASGIGQTAVMRLLGDGWTVFGLDISEDRLRATSNDPRFKPVVCDVADPNRVVAAFAEIAFAAGALDALICCAGVLRIGPLESMSVEDFDRVFNVNTRGTWLCARRACLCCARQRRGNSRRASCCCPPWRRCGRRCRAARMPHQRPRCRSYAACWRQRWREAACWSMHWRLAPSTHP